jgi:hypothetical protein
MDERLLPRGRSRAPFGRFLLWLLPWAALLGVGLYAAYLCLALASTRRTWTTASRSGSESTWTWP